MPINQKINNGFNLVEITISIFILATVLTLAIKMIVPALETSGYTDEYLTLKLLAKEKAEQIKAQGFWIEALNTQSPLFPGNPSDHSTLWKNDLALIGVNNTGRVVVTFLKEVNGELLPFQDNGIFDGDYPRDKVKIEIALYTAKNEAISQNITLFSSPTLKQITALLAILKNALDLYAYDHSGVYPVSNSLSLLVPQYLSEIPNDPYTPNKSKITHTEEITDWAYDHDAVSRRLTIAPNSHRLDTAYTLTWTY